MKARFRILLAEGRWIDFIAVTGGGFIVWAFHAGWIG